MTLDYRMRREGRLWLAFLKRPGNSRPIFYHGRTRHEAIAALLTGVGKMDAARLFGPDWSKAANQRAADQIAANQGPAN